MSNLEVGVQSVDITPPVGVVLAGYNPRISETLGHSLRAEAIACCDGKLGWILISLDAVAITRPFSQEIREEISKATGIDSHAIIIAATHTHSGPEVNQAGRHDNHPDAEYLDSLKQKLIALAIDAWNAKSEGTISYATTQAKELGSNRRIIEDGKAKMLWQDPEGNNPAYFDSDVELFGVKKGDDYDCLHVNYGCHPVTLGQFSKVISGDYVSYLKDGIEQSDVARLAMFTLSGHGDINPRRCVQNDQQVTIDMGTKLAEIVKNAKSSMNEISCTPLDFAHIDWNLKRTRGIEGHPELKDFLRFSKKDDIFDTELTLLVAGELALVALPGELVSQMTKVIQDISPYKHTIVISLGNDCVGYLPTDEIQEQGAYEPTMTPAYPLEQEILKQVKNLFDSIN